MRKSVHTEQAPAAIGPYSQAVWKDDLLFVSGQTPIVPETGKLVEGGIEAQTQQVFDNLKAILSAADLSLDNVIKLNVFLIDMEDFSAMNSVYEKQFETPFPARTTVAVAGLPLSARVEIELVARRSQVSSSKCQVEGTVTSC